MKNTKKILAIFTSVFIFVACGPTMEQTENTKNTNNSSMEVEDSMDKSMSHVQITNEKDFIVMMIPHHQEAIDTAKIVLEKSKNAELRELAQSIVNTQTREIDQMEAWKIDWFGKVDGANYEKMMPDLTKLEGEELDQAFIAGMIEHHEGAIEMAEQVKKITKRPELLDMAADIIEAQSIEIQLLKSWIK